MYPPNKYDFEPMTPRKFLRLIVAVIVFLLIAIIAYKFL